MAKKKPKATRAPGGGRKMKYGEAMVSRSYKFPASVDAAMREAAGAGGVNEWLVGVVTAALKGVK